MTDEAKALVERLRQVSSVLFDDYADGTYAVEDHAICGKAADLIETQAREIERLREDGRFLLQRLVDHEVWITSETDAREFYGHVTPAMARFRAALGESHDQ